MGLNMKMSIRGMVELAGHEGLCTKKYTDSVGVWTIGVGFTKTEIPDLASWPADRVMSMAEIANTYEKALGKYEKAVNAALNVQVPQEAFDAIVSWCYNVGTGWPKKASFIKRINNGEALNSNSLKNSFLSFNKPPEIQGRRLKEWKLMSGKGYQNGGKVNVFPVEKVEISEGVFTYKPIYAKGKIITNFSDYFSKNADELPVYKTEDTVSPTKDKTTVDLPVEKTTQSVNNYSLIEAIKNWWDSIWK